MLIELLGKDLNEYEDKEIRIEKLKHERRKKKFLLEGLLGTILFFGISLASRIILNLFFVMIMFGIVFPLIWAKCTKSWEFIGFTKKNLRKAIFWGLGAGGVFMIYQYLITLGNHSFPSLLGLQLIIGIPIWVFVLSPFQEFFFRGWIQPRFQKSMGKWIGLILTSLIFTFWHFLPPFEGTSTSTIKITTIEGILTTIGLGVMFGYIFQRTENIVAPWLAHALAGIIMILLGLITFITINP